MVTIHEEPDCGNAPRKEILRDLVVAIAERDGESIAPLLADDVAWTFVGEQHLTGRDTVLKWVDDLPPVEEVAFGTFLTHGRGAGVDGVLDLVDGARLAFCHGLRFAGAARTTKIVSVNSYLIRTTADGGLGAG
ncbi:nuclear transport factor 2 family protein [Leifsonia bigeumensis]|uniref:Nuclear transport factor 2 family protein n=1 Tax=Leifsonella bigeumensis TaxID=433643 RepID=A0ABP7FD34_9MICO